MQAVRDYALDELTSWLAEFFHAPLAPELARVYGALQDERSLAAAMAEMSSLCTPDGFALLRAGVALLQDPDGAP